MSIRTTLPMPPRGRRRRPRPARGVVPGGLLLLALALAPLAHAGAPAERTAPALAARMALDRTRLMDDVRQVLAELPARDASLRVAGRADPDREAIINRLIGLRGPELGAAPESMAVAAGLLDLLLADPGMKEQPEFTRLVRAAEGAQKLLIADPPRLRSRTRALIEERRDAGRSPGFDPSSPDSIPIPGLAPLPHMRDEPVASMLMERGAEHTWSVPTDTRVEWIPGTGHLLLIGAGNLRRVDAAGNAPPETVGPLRPGAPVAIAPTGDYVATAVRAPGDSLDRLVLYRLGPHVDGVVLARGLRVSALAWSPSGGELAVAGPEWLEIRDLDRSAPIRTSLPAPDGGIGRTSLAWSPSGERLLVLRATPTLDAAGTTREAWRLSLIEPGTGTILDASELPDGVGLAWSPDSRGLWCVTGARGIVGIDLTGDRIGAPRPVTFPMDDDPDAPHGGLLGVAWSPDGRHLALDASSTARREDDCDTFDNGILPPSLLFDAGSRPSLLSRDEAGTGNAAPPRRSSFAPAAPFDCRLEWHPTSRWLLLPYHGNLGSENVLIFDRITGDGVPLGAHAVLSATFSTDGRSVAWIEWTPPGAATLCVRRLDQGTRDPGEARRLALRGSDERNVGQNAAALVSFRNAVRLAPDVAAYRSGLGRAYRALAESCDDAALFGVLVEAAARAGTTAFLMDSQADDIRTEFVEAATLRAIVTGRLVGQRLRGGIEDELRQLPDARLETAAGRRDVEFMERLARVIQWDPADALSCILYEGLRARWAANGGAGSPTTPR